MGNIDRVGTNMIYFLHFSGDFDRDTPVDWGEDLVSFLSLVINDSRVVNLNRLGFREV